MPNAQISVGDRCEFDHTFTPEDVRTFAEVSGDHNPLHLDAVYAAETRFRRPIVHGMFVASLFSRVLASELPGPGTIYLSQDLQFKRPVFVNDAVRVVVEVVEVDRERGTASLKTTVLNGEGKPCLVGKASVMVDGLQGRV